MSFASGTDSLPMINTDHPPPLCNGLTKDTQNYF